VPSALKLALPLLLAALLPHPLRAQDPHDPVDAVNLLIGTGHGPIGYGGTMPFVTPPFGMTDWTPQTRQNKLGTVSYAYEDQTISGFIGTHQPAIWMGDYGAVTLMPEVDTLKLTPTGRQLPFDHRDESAHPDLYTVALDAGGGRKILTRMTATIRCAIFQFTFPANASSTILIEASRPNIAGFAQVDAAHNEITGYNPERTDANLGPFALPNFKGYFVVQFRKPFAHSATYGPTSTTPDSATGVYAQFTTTEGEVIEARVGTSFISIDQARLNLAAEIPTWNFATIQQSLHNAWHDKLTRITVEGATEPQRAIVYTALYHALLYPRIFSEQGRYYSAFDDKIHTGESYTAYSLWDTFRAENSLLTLLAPERIGPMVRALLQDYQQGGWMPKWPNPSYTNIMIATHADSVVAEAIRKHFTGFDYNLAWGAVYKDATTPPDDDLQHRWTDREPHTPYEARGGLTYLKTLGYIPSDKVPEGASATLEDSYDDWCVAQIARALGKQSAYDFFLHRSLNYKHLYNPATGFMQARKSDGSWDTTTAGWTEGDKWVYTWAVFHDLPGLIDLMGGPQPYNDRLDQHFAGNHNRHANEPSHHYGYLYDFSGQPWKTQSRVRQIAAAEYADLPSGIDGDDDCGQMSAWYLFTALGFYPVNPASGDYMIGSPLFRRMTLKLANGKRFTVSAPNNSDTNIYIQSATLNNHPLTIPVITWEQIQSGSTLTFVMGPTPSQWASTWHPTKIPGTPPIPVSLPPQTP